MQSTESYPRTAYLLSLIGGVLIFFLSLISAALILVVAAAFASVGFGLGAGLAIGLAVVALLFGIIVLYFARKLKSNPQNARTYGIIILIVALISFVGGGGFYIGAILAIIGGILAIVWKAPPAPAPTGYGQPMYSGAAPGYPAAPPPGGGGARFCPSCGAPIPAGASSCPKCGARTAP